MRLVLALLLALTATAFADADHDFTVDLRQLLTGTAEDGFALQLAFLGKTTVHGTITSKMAMDAALFHELRTPAIARTAAGDAAWVSGDVYYLQTVCCSTGKEPPELHALAVYDANAKIVAMALTPITTPKQEVAARAKGTLPPPLERRVAPEAEEAVKQLEATLGDAKALAKSVSARKDTVLFGSGVREHYTGAKVAATLAKWNLAMKVRDGIEAGATSGKDVVWIAANVDAGPPKKPATPYRAFFVYEKDKAGWQLVAASFSVVTP